jgi:hypothetical protein
MGNVKVVLGANQNARESQKCQVHVWPFFIPQAQAAKLIQPCEGALSGKGLARHLSSGSVRFQPLPIRTAREVFPQAAHPVSFIERVMCPVGEWRRLSRKGLYSR